mgnify:CR=1 FL=1
MARNFKLKIQKKKFIPEIITLIFIYSFFSDDNQSMDNVEMCNLKSQCFWALYNHL